MSEYEIGYHDGYADGIGQREKIVRCRECKHYRQSDDAPPSCKVVRGYVVQIMENDFCAWGERR